MWSSLFSFLYMQTCYFRVTVHNYIHILALTICIYTYKINTALQGNQQFLVLLLKSNKKSGHLMNCYKYTLICSHIYASANPTTTTTRTITKQSVTNIVKIIRSFNIRQLICLQVQCCAIRSLTVPQACMCVSVHPQCTLVS